MHTVEARFEFESQPLVGGETGELAAQLLEDAGDLEIRRLRADGPRLQLADVEEGIEEARHRTDGLLLLQQGVGGVWVRIDTAQGTVQQRQRLERLPQVMAGGRQKAALTLVRPIRGFPGLVGALTCKIRGRSCAFRRFTRDDELGLDLFTIGDITNGRRGQNMVAVLDGAEADLDGEIRCRRDGVRRDRVPVPWDACARCGYSARGGRYAVADSAPA